MVIKIRQLSTFSNVKSLLSTISTCIDNENLIFDFNDISFVKIIPAAVLAREIKAIARYRRRNNLTTRALQTAESDVLSYLRYIGYFKLIGLDSGTDMRSECHTSNYIPVTEYSYLHFKNLADGDFMRTVQDYIAEEADELSKLFSAEGQKNELISYSIKEIIRNVYEHSKADKLYIMGQYWRNGNVQIAIMDEGIGLLNTLKHKYSELSNDLQAIHAAIQPGVSGSDFSQNPNDNSGFGLYVISRLAEQLGYFVICSGTAGLKINLNTPNEDFSTQESGTLVCVHFNRIPDSYQKRFQQIIDEGNRIAQQSKYPISASKQTTSLL